MSTDRIEREYLTPPQVAKFLGAGVNSVGDFIRAGKLRAVNLGHATRPRWRISRADLEAFLAARCNQQPAAPPRRRPVARPLRQHV